MQTQAILVVSFGTSYNDSREITIGAIERTIAAEFPDYEVRRAFTSQMIISKLRERDGMIIDNVKEALERAVADGIRKLIVQPTHLMNGLEYMDLVEELKEFKEQFEELHLGEPLLTSEADYQAVIAAITEMTKEYDDGETAICYMGHGSEAKANQVYERLQDMLFVAGYRNYYIATVEAEPTIEDLITAVKEGGNYKRVILRPLMVVAGDHANNDMAGEDEDSWKTRMEQEGYEVVCVVKGLGENEAIQEIYASHVRNVII